MLRRSKKNLERSVCVFFSMVISTVVGSIRFSVSLDFFSLSSPFERFDSQRSAEYKCTTIHISQPREPATSPQQP